MRVLIGNKQKSNYNYSCGVFGYKDACGSKCDSKCYLCSCNNGYGSCGSAQLA